MSECNHALGEGSTIVTAEDGCSLKCTACEEIILQMELCSVIVDADDIEWLA